MLNFRNTNILFGAFLIIFLAANFHVHIPVVVYALTLFIYSLILFYGSYFIQADFYIKSICSVDTDKKQIAISFDDGPAESYTPQILQVLKANDVQAAFFCIGNRIAGNEMLLQAIYEQGHIIGNHSYSHHFWFDLFSAKMMLSDMRMMDEQVKKTIGLTPKLFRPPNGVTNPNVKNAIVNGGYTSVGWSLRSMDTVIKDEKKLLEKVKQSINPGTIILFHDTSKTTLGILPELNRQTKADGYEIVRLDKMCNLSANA